MRSMPSATPLHQPRGLYDPAFEHDACGVGFVVRINGTPSHDIVAKAVQCVCNVTHRGAIDADAKTGDGAGVLTQIPEAFFARILASLGKRAPPPGDLGVGVIFFPQEAKALARCRALITEALARHGVPLVAWRAVPVDPAMLGNKAAATQPVIEHLLVQRPAAIPADAFERTLFLIRRQVERAALRERIEGCYVPSFSSRTIVYKGLLVAPQLARFYHDLEEPDFASAIAVFHQRYSTNTFPNWYLAQPFRLLAHNGEINTLKGNCHWMRAREPMLRSPVWGDQLREVLPIIQEGGSDSAMLDNVLELLVRSGRDPLHAMMMLVPEAWQNMPTMDPDVRAFYQYHAYLSEPWDGPAALAFSDGRYVGATLDRNGLRPARYAITDDGLVVMASEVGVVPLDESRIVEKGRLGPGQMIAIDVQQQHVWKDGELKRHYARRRPYGQWVKTHLAPLDRYVQHAKSNGAPLDPVELLRREIAFGYTNEELSLVIEPMVKEAKEPTWSMGDDAPLAVLSQRPRLLFGYFKQLFAQVTNPPIDPLREQLVMSLNTIVGVRQSILEETAEHAQLLHLNSPVLTAEEADALAHLREAHLKAARLPMLFEASRGTEALQPAIEALCRQASEAVAGGASILILSDREVDAQHAPMPSLMAVGAVHHHLIRAGLRMRASLVVEAGDAHEIHHFATLIGYGASAIYPHLAYDAIRLMVQSGEITHADVTTVLAHYRKAVEQGILKIMSKMGISTLGSYRGAQIFEAIGIAKPVIDRCFVGTVSRVGGVDFTMIAKDVLHWHRRAFQPASEPLHLEEGGFYKYRRDGEYHAFNPEMVRHLQTSIKLGDYDTYRKYAQVVNTRPPTTLRDLLEFTSDRQPIPVEDVEPVSDIVKRFATASISYGALSLEAHETIAIAMNRLGAKSGSGEGGEDPARLHPKDPQFNKCSAVKQVASGRFGVTPEYLRSARELEIKMAQGSKPGEGGQLPGHKVSTEIARVRHTIPGITLISPPPHHDIYSIEDIAQLIYDLKQINPKAKVCVKLVAEAGVGTVAAGVAKAHADVVLISGHDGGTGASPLSSIKNAGGPWELGLAETQQTLVLNGLRGRILVRTDGGMKTGRDVVIAAMLGAEEYGFGTAAVVATGCVMTRQCHLNTCPVGVATQDPKLRARFAGTPEMVVNFLMYVAQEIREILAGLGYRRLEEVIGRSDLLMHKAMPQAHPKIASVDVSAIIAQVPDAAGPRYHTQGRNDWIGDVPLDLRMIRDAQAAITSGTPVRLSYAITNVHRTVGARLAGELADRYGDRGLPEGTVDLTFRGSAGQSFGAFCLNGMRLTLHGEANDYVGKSMAGGELIVRPSEDARYPWHRNVLMGNTVMYGATAGTLYAAGRAGERFCVRNSGGNAVVEGVGDHGCEYMTSGVVVVLGETGRNFGAGMTGGRAFVFNDPDEIARGEQEDFTTRYNPELIHIWRLGPDSEDAQVVRTLLERHVAYTGSRRAQEILASWDESAPKFWVVAPKGVGPKLEVEVTAKGT